MTDDHQTQVLTRGMRATLIAVGAVVLIGVAVTIWLLVSGGAAGGGSADPGASTSPATTATRGPIPGSTPTTGSEVLPPTATGPNQLPSRTPAAPLISAPLPKSSSEQGALVAGFPTKIMGPIKGSDVLSSSIATQGATMQVTLVARTDASQKKIRAHYEKLWASLGLAENSTGGNVAYVGPYESLTLAVQSTGTGIQYSIFGVFRTK